MQLQEAEEFFLSESLELLGETPQPESSTIQYGELVLSIAPKTGRKGESFQWSLLEPVALNIANFMEANTLLADQLFSPSLLLAEQIERGLLSFPEKTLVELGAGCALPSLLASTLPNAPALVVATDYPSPIILSNLEANVKRNVRLAQSQCRVLALGHEWGTDVSTALEALPSRVMGFDVVLMSDLLHFDSSHSELAKSLVALLRRDPDARVYAAAGKYTAWSVCQSFLAETGTKGIAWSSECSADDPERETWLGSLEVKGLSREDLSGRKSNCYWWVGKWSLEVFSS